MFEEENWWEVIMGRAPKTCSWRDPNNESIGCAKTAVVSPNGEDFRCEEHWRKSWDGVSDKRRRIPALTQTEKEYIRHRDFGVCAECGEPAVDVDHIVEVADGGTNLPENLQLLCLTHHKAKTAASAQAWDEGERRNTSSRARLNRRRRAGKIL